MKPFHRSCTGNGAVVARLADALVELGHPVTLFASGDAGTRSTLVPMRDQAIRLDPSPLKSDLAAHLAMLHEVRLRADQFDVLHFHIDMIHFPFFEHCAKRTVTTLHGRLDIKDLPEAYRRWPQYPLVSISNDQSEPLPFTSWISTVYHGLPSDLYRFSPRGDGYLAFVGRIAPEERPDRAIDVARRAGRLLKIAAKVDPVDATYFRDVIKPMLAGPHTDFVGEIRDAEKSDLLGGAAALLFPIDRPEPFGLVMIEAMACGTPVIAWNRGSVFEVIHGFRRQQRRRGTRALRKIESLDRRRVRKQFEHRFSARVMARNYVDIYSHLAQAGAKREQRLQSA